MTHELPGINPDVELRLDNVRVELIVGATHSRATNYLPEELGEVKISWYNDHKNSPVLQAIFDVQDGKLSDEEIQRVWREKGINIGLPHSTLNTE